MRKPRTLLLNPDGVSPLSIDVRRTVRFEELDPMGVMWHGRYPGWFEDGRVSLGRRYGISYLAFYEVGMMAPIRNLTIDYCRPLRHDTEYTIHTELLWCDAARIDHRYEIRNRDGAVMTRAASTQMLTDFQGNLQLELPAFYRDFLARWKAGDLQ